ncbi:MAG: hypothetical protein Ta2D_02750 [Rickettsiales bacterium]|nr:MAG: hypothetical protein Ta2D_02750 [Rickettsiales bacterium]
MVSKKLIKKYELDEEEIDLLQEEGDDIENEKFFETAIKNQKQYKKGQQSKLITMNARIDVIDKIKEIASNLGLNYQSFINMILKQVADKKIKVQFN